MNKTSRMVVESPIYQGEDEQIVYTLTTTPWGSTPTNVAVTLYSVSTLMEYTDVSSTCLSGSASVDGDTITTPIVKLLVEDTLYQLEIKFTCSGNVLEAFCLIRGQK